VPAILLVAVSSTPGYDPSMKALGVAYLALGAATAALNPFLAVILSSRG
jgi:uncharacterized ion transporter superfamily protein YfcC